MNIAIRTGILVTLLAISNLGVVAADKPKKLVEIKTLNLKPIFKTKSDWHISAFQSPGAKDDPSSGEAAKVCFWTDKVRKEQNCTRLESANEFDPSTTYPHQNVSRLEAVKLTPTLPALVMSAEFSGGGSGTLVRNQVWTYAAKQDTFDELIKINLTEQGQIDFINSGPLAGDMITADAYWQYGESHFEPHRFHIDVYKITQGEVATYTKILSYITSKKYPSLDAGAINVIRPELNNTIAKLKALYGPKLSPI